MAHFSFYFRFGRKAYIIQYLGCDDPNLGTNFGVTQITLRGVVSRVCSQCTTFCCPTPSSPRCRRFNWKKLRTKWNGKLNCESLSKLCLTYLQLPDLSFSLSSSSSPLSISRTKKLQKVGPLQGCQIFLGAKYQNGKNMF
jgi:hypothetical protein